MIFIGEDTINTVIEELEGSNDQIDDRIEQLKSEEPTVLAYVTSEQFDMLNAEERDYLIYLVQVIFHSINTKVEEMPELEETQIGSVEEQNWERMEAAKGKTFRDRLDGFFKDYEQEDLLAFVEDSLVEDEDSFMTSEGRELIFVALKTIIDAFHTHA